MSKTITLRGTSYPVERVTKTAFLGLAARLQQDGPALSMDDRKSAAKIALALSSSEYQRDLSYWLKFICPSLPDELVWNDDRAVPAYGTTLEPEELLQLIGAYQALLPQEEEPAQMSLLDETEQQKTETERFLEAIADKGKRQEFFDRVLKEERAKEIGELKARLAMLESGVG